MKIVVVGSGYVGLVTGACLAHIGHTVQCVDVMPERVAAINSGKAPFFEPGLDDLLVSCLRDGRLTATAELARAVQESEVTFIAVGTPFGNGVIDLAYVRQAAKEIGEALRGSTREHLVVVKSTVVPGTSADTVGPILRESSGRSDDLMLCMNPEFLREGSAVEDFMEPDRIVIGQRDARSGDVLAKVYDSFDCEILRTTLQSAELIKYTSNALLANLVSFSNEIADICAATPGTDIETVMDALHLDKRLSPTIDGQRIRPSILSYLRAGCGYGGSCLPKDIAALRSYAGGIGLSTPLLDGVSEVNKRRPGRVVDLAEDAIGSLKGATVTVLGLAFKAGTDDIRESPALPIIAQLSARGATVRVLDPAVKLPRDLEASGVIACSTPEEAFTDADAVILATAWPEFRAWDWAQHVNRMRQAVVIDGRNALRHITWPEHVKYRGVGKNELGQANSEVESLAVSAA